MAIYKVTLSKVVHYRTEVFVESDKPVRKIEYEAISNANAIPDYDWTYQDDEFYALAEEVSDESNRFPATSSPQGE